MKSLVVSVCVTAVTDMAVVPLLVFFWVLLGSSGVLLAFFWRSSGVLLEFFWRSSGVLLVFFCVIEHQHQKNARRTPGFRFSVFGFRHFDSPA